MAWNIVYDGGRVTPDAVAYADLTAYSLPSNSRPALLESYTDPWFPNQTVTRLTSDGGNFPAASTSAQIGVIYSKRPVETGDYIIQAAQWLPRVLSRATGAWLATEGFPYATYPSRRYPGRVWGENNSSTTFAYNDKYRGGSSSTQEIWDPAGYSVINMGIGEGWFDVDENYAPMYCKRTDNSTWDIVILRLSDATPVATFSTGLTGANPGNTAVNWISMSPSGQYVVAQMGNNTAFGRGPGWVIWDRDMNYLRTISDQSNQAHADLGWLADGATEVLVLVGGDDSSLRYYRLADGSGPNVVLNGYNGGVTMWRWNTHVSMKSFDRPGWVYICTHDFNMTGYPAYKGHNLVCAVELATGLIEPWCCSQHSESNADIYHHSPFAVPSWDGKRVYFNSTWRSTTSSDNAHLYVVKRTTF